MEAKNRLTLSKYRLEKAEEDLNVARDIFGLGSFNASVNRSYYAMFHAIRAVLALDGFDAKKHSSVISHFSANYTRTGIFDKSLSSIIWTGFVTRGYSDYKDYYEATPEKAQEQIDNAEYVISLIKPYLESTWAEMENKS